MIKAILARLQQGHRTMKYPRGPAPALPPLFRGLPRLDATKCASGSAARDDAPGGGAPPGAGSCDDCFRACPTGALSGVGGLRLDLGRCLFCGACESACPAGAIAFGGDHRLSVGRREDLLVAPGAAELELAAALGKRLRRLLGRSLKLRQVSAGGCNACEADVNVLNTVGWDLGRFGIQFVASPRHADGVLVTGPVTKNMELALRKTWDAIPGPKIAIAVGSCAISGGPYAGLPESGDGVGQRLPIDLFVPGCPPHPLTILDGLLRLVGRLR